MRPIFRHGQGVRWFAVDDIVDLGTGPSINKDGWVAFRGSVLNDQGQAVDTVFVRGPGDTVPVSLIGTGFLNAFMPPRDTDQPPFMKYGDDVQINDLGQVKAHRELDALGLVGMPAFAPFGLTQTQFLLTYLETYDATRAKHLPDQVAMGDMNIQGAGLQWGNPYYQDLVLSGYLQLLAGFSIVGMAAAGAAMFTPTAWLLNPVWGSLYLSPIDTSGSFATVYRDGSINNLGQSAFAATTSSTYGDANFLVTTPHDPNGVNFLGVGTPGFVAHARIADNGTIVLRNTDGAGHNQIYALTHDLSPANYRLIAGPNADPALDFIDVGPNPAISDDGSLIVFTAVHRTLGKGVFIADPATGKWSKVAGVSGDGILDGGEEWVDKNKNNKVDPGEDFGPFADFDIAGDYYDANLAINTDSASTIPLESRRYQIALMATTSSANSPTGYTAGLHTLEIRVDPAFPGNANGALLKHSRVVGIGETLARMRTVTDIRLNDVMNQGGALTFWVTASTGDTPTKFILSAAKPGIDLAVDSNGDGLAGDEDALLEDESIEDRADLPGAVLKTSQGDVDVDGDGVADYRDGFDLDGKPGTADDVSTNLKFSHLVLSIPDSVEVDWENAVVRIEYDAADPLSLATNPTAPDQGTLRIWTKDGGHQRNPHPINSSDGPGDYVAPGTYSLSTLGLSQSNRRVLLFLEATDTTTSLASRTIKATLVDPQTEAAGSAPPADTVLVTASTFDLQIDSDNNNDFSRPDGSLYDEAVEENAIDAAQRVPGKIVQVNDDDLDGDLIPGFADGFGLLRGRGLGQMEAASDPEGRSPCAALLASLAS